MKSWAKTHDFKLKKRRLTQIPSKPLSFPPDFAIIPYQSGRSAAW